MSSQIIIDRLKTLPQTLSSYMTRTFFQSGRTGYVKLGFASLLALWGLNFLGRTYGLLPKKSVKGVHIFITGAGSGIGRQMAILLARRGAKISIVDINLDAAQAVEATLKQEGLEGKAIYCDVTDSQTVRVAAQTARAAFGDVEILINNAGIVSGKKVLDNSEKMIEKTYQVNSVSHAYTVREFLPEMLRRNKGHIVTIASVASTIGVCGLADYCGSKFAAFGFDESLRMELTKLKSNVKTTCICPYYINTGMFEGVRSRFSLFFPILSEAYASKRIVNAILQEEKVTVLPGFYNIIFLMRALLPVWAFDTVADLIGANSSMDHFVGRVKPQ